MNKEISPTNATLRPPWLAITCAAWMVMTLTAFTLAALGLAKSWGEPLPLCTPEQAACAPWVVSQEDISLAQQASISRQFLLFVYYSALIFPKLAFGSVGMLIFWRRSHDWVAQVLSLMLTLFVLEGIPNLGALKPLADGLYAISTLAFGIFPFVFPNGRYVPRWIAWLAIPNTLLSTSAVFTPQLGLQITENVYALLILIPFLIWFLLAGYSVIYRYKYVSNPTERQQTKWVMAGILGSFSLFVPFTIISVYFPPSQPSLERLSFVFMIHYPIYFVSYLFITGGVAFAILRYRLWDIDILIRRTLQYALLTGLLALVYLGGVVILQAMLGSLTGEAKSPIVTVIITLGIAALFNLLRHQVQDFIDRRFYRKKYIAERALEAFAASAHDEVDLDLLAGALVHVVDETIQPESNWLWLKTK